LIILFVEMKNKVMEEFWWFGLVGGGRGGVSACLGQTRQNKW